MGFIRYTGGAALPGPCSFALRAIRWSTQSRGRLGGSDAVHLAFSLSRSRIQVVGWHCFHVKQHAFLPVGRMRSWLVRRARISHAAAGHDGPAMEARNDLVLDAFTGKLAASSAWGDALHLRRPRFRRRFWGSAIGDVRLTAFRTQTNPLKQRAMFRRDPICSTNA